MDILTRFDELRSNGMSRPTAIVTSARELAARRSGRYEAARVEIEQAIVLRSNTPSRNLGAL